MDLSRVRDLMIAARSCAFAMLENATYIQRELPNVPMDRALRARTELLCSQLIGTKHDIISEVCELAEVLDAGAPESEVAKRVERIVRWLADDIGQVQALVTDLEAARLNDAAYGLAYVLVAESAANVLQAFNRTRAAAAELQKR